MQKSDYAILKENIRNFVDLANTSLAYSIDGREKFRNSQFVALEGMLKIFDGFPEIASLKGMSSIKEAIELAYKPKPLMGSSKYMKEAGRIICANTRAIVARANEVAAKIRPSINPETREPIIKLIQKYRSGRDISGKEGFLQIIEFLNGLKYLDPDLGEEDEVADVMKDLIPYVGSPFSLYLSDEMLKHFRASVEPVIWLTKVNYNIKEDEISKPKEVMALQNELFAAYTRIEKLNEELDALREAKTVPVEIVLKSKEKLEKLRELNGEVSSKIGRNRPVNDVYDTLYEMVGTIEKIIFTGFSERLEDLTQEDRYFLTRSYELHGRISGLKPDSLFDDSTKNDIKDYSYEIERFIQRKSGSQVGSVFLNKV